MLEARQSICTIFQAASATAAKSKTTAEGSIALDLGTYKAKEIEDEFKKTSVITSVALAVRGNRKDKLGSNWADHERCGLSEDELITTRLRSVLKTPLAAKIIAGEVVGGEDLWRTKPWLMESTQMWAKLIYRFEGMTEMINGAFMDDLGELLSSVTGISARRCTKSTRSSRRCAKYCSRTSQPSNH